MNKKSFSVIALLIFAMPFLGIPDSWKAYLLMITGCVIAGIIFKDDIQQFFSVPKPMPGQIIQTDSFVESAGPAKSVS